MLEQEKNFYNENRSLWMVQYPDKFLLIKGDRLIGAYDTEDEALSEGARNFGLTSFLVRKSGELEQEVTIPAYTLGLLSANPAPPK